MTVGEARETAAEKCASRCVMWAKATSGDVPTFDSFELHKLIADEFDSALRRNEAETAEAAARIADELCRLNTGPNHGYSQVAAEMAASIAAQIRSGFPSQKKT